MKKVLQSQKIHAVAHELLEGRFENIILPDSEQSTLADYARDIDAIIMRTNVKLTRDIIEKATNLKIVSRTGAGVDNVDVEACTEKGVLVCNTVGINTTAVVEHTIAFILALAKQHYLMDKGVRDADWQIRRRNIPMEVDGKTLGIIGMGSIGSMVAKIMHDSFNMRILAYDPFLRDYLSDFDYIFTDDLRELFTSSDFISVHCPNIPETQGLVSKELIDMMKESAFLINTARGEVVDQSALTDALQKGQISGAALDVFREEPPAADEPLLKMKNVLMSPHSAALTEETTIKVAVEAVMAIIDFFEGRDPKNIFNKTELKNQ